MQTCSSQSKLELKDAICLFCDKSADSEGLHIASTHVMTDKHFLLHQEYCECKSDIAVETDCLLLEQWCELRA